MFINLIRNACLLTTIYSGSVFHTSVEELSTNSTELCTADKNLLVGRANKKTNIEFQVFVSRVKEVRGKKCANFINQLEYN